MLSSACFGVLLHVCFLGRCFVFGKGNAKNLISPFRFRKANIAPSKNVFPKANSICNPSVSGAMMLEWSV